MDSLIDKNDENEAQEFIASHSGKLDIKRLQAFCYGEQYCFHPDSLEALSYCIAASQIMVFLQGTNHPLS